MNAQGFDASSFNLNSQATNELYRYCYKEASKSSKGQVDSQAILRCHNRLGESFKLLVPFIIQQDE